MNPILEIYVVSVFVPLMQEHLFASARNMTFLPTKKFPRYRSTQEIPLLDSEDASSIKDVPCTNEKECVENYTPGLDFALKLSTMVSPPMCENYTDSSYGICSCGEKCLSRSKTVDENEFFYCGPCGRVGSVCSDARSCDPDNSVCMNGYCHCKNGGTFYEFYICVIPYYGYEVALEMAFASCIIIALGLLVGSIYNAMGFRNTRRIQRIRQLILRQGINNGHPNDTPPKYDDVVEDLPTYQEAIQLDQNENRRNNEGRLNSSFLPEIPPGEAPQVTKEVHNSRLPSGISEEPNNSSESKFEENDRPNIQNDNFRA